MPRRRDVVCLPAKCDRADDPLGRAIGEYLWPEWFTPVHWEEFERNPRTWSALYQQKPAPDTGIFFEAAWLKTYSVMPLRETLSVYGASDYAVTEGRGDYTAHIVIGIDPAGHLYVLDLWRGQTASDVWVEVLCDLIKRWKPIAWGEEAGQIRAGIGPFLEQRLRERRAYVARKSFPARGNKETRRNRSAAAWRSTGSTCRIRRKSPPALCLAESRSCVAILATHRRRCSPCATTEPRCRPP